jgi:hypothetical protein
MQYNTQAKGQTMNTELEVKAEELDEIRFAIIDLLDRAGVIMKGTGMTEKRAESYWMAHIKAALGSGYGYAGGSMVTMEETADEIRVRAISESA